MTNPRKQDPEPGTAGIRGFRVGGINAKKAERSGFLEEEAVDNAGIDYAIISVYNTHVKSAAVMKILKDDGWYVFNIRGSHHQFKHPSKPDKVTVPHPKSDLPKGTVKGVLKQAGIDKE